MTKMILPHPDRELSRLLSSVRLQLGARRVLVWMVRAVGLASLLCVVGLGLSRLISVSMPASIWFTFLLFACCVGAAIGIRRWPTQLETARQLDRHFDLADRVTTAYEFRGSMEEVSVRQRADMEARTESLRTRESARGQFRGWELGVAASALALVLVLAGLPSGGAHAETPATSNHQRASNRQIHRISKGLMPKVIARTNRNVSTTVRKSTAMRRLEKTLRKLERKLSQAHNRKAALKAISATQSRLRALKSGLHPVSTHASSQLAQSLSQMLSHQEQSQVAHGGTKATKALSRALSKMARSLQHMTAAQRAQLAQALARAANNPAAGTLRSSLRQAASSLAYDNRERATHELNKVSKQLSKSPALRNESNRINSATSRLNTLKNSVARSATGSDQTPVGSGKTGNSNTGKSGRKGANGGQPTGSKGQGSRGTSGGQGRRTGGRGSKGGRGQGSNTSRNSRPGMGHGGNNGEGSQGRRSGRSGARVYIPGVNGKGSHTVENGGPSGKPSHGATVPYTRVIERYDRSAHAALDHTALPPALNSYIRQYFTSISH